MSFRRATVFLGILIAVRLIQLAWIEQLNLYIHPRYIAFTITMAVLALILLATAKNDMHKNKRPESAPSYVPVAIIATFLFVLALPAQPLSSQIAQARQQSQTTVKSNAPTSFDAYTSDYSHFDIEDWVSFLATRPSDETITGKKAAVTGFIYSDGADNLSVARFRLSCCAVDATPLNIPIRTTSNDIILTRDAWYELSGSFSFESDKQSYVLNIETAKQIEVPKDQYVY